MTFTQAIKTDLIAAIVAKCGVSPERAAAELKAGAATARTLNAPLTDTLRTLGLI
jgi:hypothetical protein